MADEVNYIRHLNRVYAKMAEDESLRPHHLSLYWALFHLWNSNHFENPLSINRQEMLKLSKIGSANTYSKSLKALDQAGFIRYEPSHSPMIGSKVSCIRFDTSADTTGDTSTDTTGVQLLIPSNKRSKRKKRKKREGKARPQALTEVIQYFESVKDEKRVADPRLEAEKFYNHFSANGWKVGGKTAMKDWKAAARNWMLNGRKYAAGQDGPRAGHLQTQTQKNYNEPL